jgi:hypothetical protein
VVVSLNFCYPDRDFGWRFPYSDAAFGGVDVSNLKIGEIKKAASLYGEAA